MSTRHVNINCALIAASIFFLLINFSCVVSQLKRRPDPIMQNFKHYERIVVYGAKPPWTDTNITVQKKDVVIFLASGEVSISRRRTKLSARQRLVYRIGEEMFPEPIHKSYGDTFDFAIKAGETGKLQLAVIEKNIDIINSELYRDNTGSFLVDIFVIDKDKEEIVPDLLTDLAQSNPQDKIFHENVEKFVRRSKFYLAKKKTTLEIQETKKEIQKLKDDRRTKERKKSADTATGPAREETPSLTKVKEPKQEITPTSKQGESAAMVTEKDIEIAQLESKLDKLEKTLALLEVMKRQYEAERSRSDLLAKELVERDKREKLLLTQLEKSSKIPPVIVLTSPLPDSNVEINFTHLSGVVQDEAGVERLDLFLNNRLLSEGDGRGLIVRGMRNSKRFEFKRRIPLEKGVNQLKVRAIDSDGLISEKELTVTYIDKNKKLLAVIIGIDTYPNIRPLKYAVNDANLFYEHMVKFNHIAAENVILLLNKEATLRKIRKTLGTTLKKRAGKDDMVVIYFAGHGATEKDAYSPDGDGLEKYLLPYDADLNDLYSTALPMGELSRIFKRIASDRLIYIADACYSGASGGRTIETSGMRANISDAFMDRIASGKGRVIITASGANEVSAEKDELKHGVFTYYLVEGMKGKADIDKDGVITVDEAYNYVSRTVPQATGQEQHPVKKGSVEGRFVMSLVE